MVKKGSSWLDGEIAQAPTTKIYLMVLDKIASPQPPQVNFSVAYATDNSFNHHGLMQGLFAASSADRFNRAAHEPCLVGSARNPGARLTIKHLEPFLTYRKEEKP